MARVGPTTPKTKEESGFTNSFSDYSVSLLSLPTTDQRTEPGPDTVPAAYFHFLDHRLLRVSSHLRVHWFTEISAHHGILSPPLVKSRRVSPSGPRWTSSLPSVVFSEGSLPVDERTYDGSCTKDLLRPTTFSPSSLPFSREVHVTVAVRDRYHP